ncbi:MAG: hypothetical protein JWO22_2922 [Frankiales bacterium]|nr:hypothetical protein [Frankiales bacterium]
MTPFISVSGRTSGTVQLGLPAGRNVLGVLGSRGRVATCGTVHSAAHVL